ncbi:hypothetical protein KKH36_01140 [Patescibacteria group bacterium]|nr:hypothetical protein [Patescibacteria group bacterium]
MVFIIGILILCMVGFIIFALFFIYQAFPVFIEFFSMIKKNNDRLKKIGVENNTHFNHKNEFPPIDNRKPINSDGSKVSKRELFFDKIEPYLFCFARCCGLFLRFFFRFNMSPRTLCLLDSLSFKLMKYQKVLFQSFLVSLVSGIGGVCWFYPDVNVKIVMAVPMILFLLLVLEIPFLLWNSMVNH